MLTFESIVVGGIRCRGDPCQGFGGKIVLPFGSFRMGISVTKENIGKAAIRLVINIDGKIFLGFFLVTNGGIAVYISGVDTYSPCIISKSTGNIYHIAPRTPSGEKCRIIHDILRSGTFGDQINYTQIGRASCRERV